MNLPRPIAYIAFAVLVLLALPLAFGAATGPGASAGSFYKVKVAAGLDKAGAENMQRQMQVDGFTAIELREQDGKFTVLAGACENEDQAKALLQSLKTEGYNPLGVQAPGEQAGAGQTVSTAEAGKAYRVEVNTLRDKLSADELKKSLIQDGYFGVEVVQDGTSFHVYLGMFPTTENADIMKGELQRDGYSAAKVAATFDTAKTSARASAAEISPDKMEIPSELKTAIKSPEQEKEVRDLMTGVAKADTGLMTAQELIELRRKQQALEAQIGQVVNAVSYMSKSEQQKSEQDKQIRQLYVNFSQNLGTQNWTGAEQILAQIRNMNPADPSLDFKTEVLNRMRNNQKGAVSAASEQENQAKLQQLLSQARDAESKKNYAEARRLYSEVTVINPQHAEAKARLEQIATAERSADSTGGTGITKNQYFLYGGIGVGVLLVVILIYVLMQTMQNTKRERELIRQMQELTHAEGRQPHAALPAPELAFATLGGTSTATPAIAGPTKEKKKKKGKGEPASTPLFAGPLIVDTPAVTDEEEPEPEEEKPEIVATETAEHRMEDRPAGEADVLFLSGINDTGSQPQVTQGEPVQEPEPLLASGTPDFVSFEDLNIPLPGEETKTAAPPPSPVAPAVPAGPPEIDLDALLKGDMFPAPPGTQPAQTARIQDIAPSAPVAPAQAAPKQAAAPPAPPAPSDLTPFDVTTQFPTPPGAEVISMPDIPAPPIASEPPPVAAAAPGSSNGAFFEQSFEQESVGVQPGGWQGEYDYASLTVDDQAPANGSGHCLKFEKRAGAGSANYVCSFPKASGHVGIEFDIRCDEKNKYLLGFYIEKDEDFKQSVHTIVHRTDSKSQPSLRIQGEPIPYELGSWRHVKYDLNLLAGIVNAFVDGEQIVKDGKLPTNPAYINTLSIRDNLATTGVLYLDNIKIYKA